MKPLSEFAEGLRAQKADSYSNENADRRARGFSEGMAHAGVLLQAWLREADDFVVQYGSMGFSICSIRLKILGTTRMEGKK